jgi:hypothetical protein
MKATLGKVVAVALIGILLVGVYVVLSPDDVQAKPPRPPGPPLPCDHCPGTIKDPPCICHLIDCTPEDCAYVCNCW